MPEPSFSLPDERATSGALRIADVGVEIAREVTGDTEETAASAPTAESGSLRHWGKKSVASTNVNITAEQRLSIATRYLASIPL